MVRHEGGFALLSVLIVLVALSFIGGAAAMVSSNEVKLSGLYGVASRAADVAQAGLEHASGHYVTNGATAGWPVTGSLDGYAYSVGIARDSFDFGSGRQPVYWDAALGFNGSGAGSAVWVLTSTASRGPYRSVQRLRMSSQGLSVETEAAFSANSGIMLRGNITVSGLNHNMSGQAVNPGDTANTGACSENKAAIRMSDADETVDKQGSVTLEGNAAFAAASPAYVEYNGETVWHTPEQVLGLPDGALEDYKQSGDQYNANVPDTLSGIIYVTDDFGSSGAGSGNIQGTGVLIVHNPLYNPREHDPEDPMYNASRASDPLYQPANLGNVNGGTFKGLIIADKVDKINGSVQIYGSVVSLTEIDVNIVGAGTADVRYSCTAIQTVSNTIVAPRRLAWMAE